jgi:hypothetical protein
MNCLIGLMIILFKMDIGERVPNITYISIGSGDKQYCPTEPTNNPNCSSTLQQFPPCLHKYFGKHINIFMIDKVEDDNNKDNACPSFCETYGLVKEENGLWTGNNVRFTWLQEHYDFETSYPKMLIDYLNIIWETKQHDPNNIYMVFIQDFSGHNLALHESVIRTYFNDDYFNQIVAFTVNDYGTGCFLNLMDEKLYPKIMDGCIFNVYAMSPLEIATCFYYGIELDRVINMLEIKMGYMFNNELFGYRNNVEVGGPIIVGLLRGIFNFLEYIRFGLFNECWGNIEEYAMNKDNIYKVKDFIRNGFGKLLKIRDGFDLNNNNLLNHMKHYAPWSIILLL